MALGILWSIRSSRTNRRCDWPDMTAIIGIRCKDGVVIGADSSVTLGDGNHVRTIEQLTKHKIRIIGGKVILTGTGTVGHGQRFREVIKALYEKKEFQGKTGLEIAKLLSRGGLLDFKETGLDKVPYSAFVAYPASDGPTLCEFPGKESLFQPELKELNDLWFASAGSGVFITDPFLALFRELFWKDGPPKINGGVFMAVWALIHACNLNVGGIKGPINIAVLEAKKGKYSARLLDDSELAEHRNIVDAASNHFGKFKDILEGEEIEATVPLPKSD